ncbi:uncharacterized protein LOC105445314 [Strongylocentrotus purpuratus]|uniref:C2H2-type domain-containing protein n=1 Tax=Strongylocentrotus purpuratus TaxID=7668 RepID=A0A7M7LTR1_STRPU|nr:uncharacterized protein LOC105445314 [Strongylocentrotus purpuratus]
MEIEKTNLRVIKIEIIALPPSSEELGFQPGESLEHGCRVDSGQVCDKINKREEIHREKCSKNGWTGVADAIETQKAQPTEEADGKTITSIKEEPLDIDDIQFIEDEETRPETQNKSMGIRKGIRTSGVQPFHCSHCDKRFSSKGNHSKHLRKMHCQCSLCNQTFPMTRLC